MTTSQAQIDFQSQVNEMGNALPEFFYGYTDVISKNIGYSLLQGNQIQHRKKRWRLHYSMSLSTMAYNRNANILDKISTSSFGNHTSTRLSGSFNNCFGGTEPNYLSQYLLDADGNLVVNPTTGEYVKYDLELVGGIDKSLIVVPTLMPYIEFRVWKGISINAGYMPLGSFISRFEVGGFQAKTLFYGIGMGVQLNQFFKTPFFSWFSFGANYNELSLKLENIQDAMDIDFKDYVKLQNADINLETNTSAFQMRASFTVPIIKPLSVFASVSQMQFKNKFTFDASFDAVVDNEKVQEKYGYKFDKDSYHTDVSYSNSFEQSPIFVYNFGVLLEGKSSQVLLSVAPVPMPVFTIKAGIKIF